jgi:hypothetical protein
LNWRESVANVVIPGQEQNKHMGTDLAFKPGTNEVFIMACGEEPGL